MSATINVKRFGQRAACALLALAVIGLLAHPADADSWPGPSFREFSGVNQAGVTDGLYPDAIGWERHDLDWPTLEPHPGQWQADVLARCGQTVLALKKSGVTYLPMLGYTPAWAVAANRKKDVPARSADWTNYITKTVRYLHAAPYNVQYFQIWNEASTKSGFWSGTMDEYMTRVHLPAAAAIHAAGGRVVYGGWPCCESIPGLIEFLDRYHAWGSIDVLDIHYFNPGDMAALRAAADARGYRRLGIWQTEIGFTSDPGYIANSYPRFLYWALTNHWNRADKYKIFYFADWAPGDPAAAWNYQHCLWSGAALNFHGVILKNLGTLLGGPNLAAASGVTATPALTGAGGVAASALEAFQVGRTVVAAMHLAPGGFPKDGILTLDFPLRRERIARAERIDLAGESTDITSALAATGPTTRLRVSPQERAGSDAASWNAATKGPRTFYVRLILVR